MKSAKLGAFSAHLPNMLVDQNKVESSTLQHQQLLLFISWPTRIKSIKTFPHPSPKPAQSCQSSATHKKASTRKPDLTRESYGNFSKRQRKSPMRQARSPKNEEFVPPPVSSSNEKSEKSPDFISNIENISKLVTFQVLEMPEKLTPLSSHL